MRDTMPPCNAPPRFPVPTEAVGKGRLSSFRRELVHIHSDKCPRPQMSDEAQQPVIDFLSDAGSHGGAPVKRIDTHAALVFLAGDRVLKIKRAVRFPFLDFSTLGKRRVACEAEINVNLSF